MKVLMLCITCLLMVSCVQDEAPELPAISGDEISAPRLWERIRGESNYEDYDFWPGHDGLRLGQSPHGAFHKVYINTTLRDALPQQSSRDNPGEKTGTAPNGSIIVKENYDVNEELVNLTVMAKAEGYSDEYQDWFWVVYGTDGAVLAEGELMSCIVCHEGAKSNDYVIIGDLP